MKGWGKRKDGVQGTILVSDYLVFTIFSARHYDRRRWPLSSLSIPDQSTYLSIAILRNQTSSPIDDDDRLCSVHGLLEVLFWPCVVL